MTVGALRENGTPESVQGGRITCVSTATASSPAFFSGVFYVSKSALSVLVFGVYLSILALGFLIFPNTALSLLGLPHTNEVWIRVVGMLLLGMSYYYIQMSRLEFKPFFRFSAQARAMVIVFIIVFLLLDYTKIGLLILALVDFLAALWTAFALKSESESIFKIT